MRASWAVCTWSGHTYNRVFKRLGTYFAVVCQRAVCRTERLVKRTKLEAMADDEQIEQVASMMFAAALAFTNTIGRRGWAWEQCDEQTKHYWRTLARHAWTIFNTPNQK